MRPGSGLAPTRPQAQAPIGPRAPRPGTCQVWATTTSRGAAGCVALALRARACVGGGTEPVEARKDGEMEVEAGLAPEELEVLEEEAIAGKDEGHRPTDYDCRARIFEESSRVFRALKQRRDGDSGDHDGVKGGAAPAEATAREQQQQLG
ncbi:uncharacterized protein LOC133911023 [Phragmites australis]|uniref:uncharacterized protein LOC133911023 n=1 Tax=Phragmites australis TaxID=29695 RepID=UPI002D772D55|nr:uncharacterized protein LOC133911023 [Phragmites australis]